MLFLSDNAAAVHPAVWDALKAADEPDSPYDGDRWSAALDDRFSQLFGRRSELPRARHHGPAPRSGGLP